jgi:hypothetical protein
LEGNRSEESILPLQGSTITKSTVVTIEREIDPFEHAVVGKQRQQNGMWGNARSGLVKGSAPETRVEDGF